MKKIIVIICLISSFYHYSQDFDKNFTKNINLKSPDTYSFLKRGNVPVNLHTGAIDLKIPITSFDINNSKKITVNLSYDSSGFTPHKKTDLAGLNWSLLAGGKISRKVNYVPDEHVGVNPLGSDYDLHGYLTGVRRNLKYSKDKYYDLYSEAIKKTETISYLGSPEEAYEGEPDEFNFSVMGLQGKFMIDNTGEVLVESNDPNIKVDLSNFVSYNTNDACFPPNSEIILTDGEGNKYFFGGDYSKFEISYSNTSADPSLYEGNTANITSFSISKIILANKDEIIFNYETGGSDLDKNFCLNGKRFLSLTDDTKKLLSLDRYITETDKAGTLSLSAYDFGGGGYASDQLTIIDKTILIKKSLLKNILFKDYKINIDYIDTNEKIQHGGNGVPFNEYLIGSIATYYKDALIEKKSLEYTALGGTNKRLFLTKIKDLDPKNTFTFEYYNTNDLPSYSTRGIDHWGYWNGKDNNQYLYLSANSTYDMATGDYTLGDTCRDLDISKSDVCMLKKITYPTKGYTVFEYEPHTYSKRLERNSASKFLPTLTNNSGYVGGCRIKKQTDFSQTGLPENEKVYKYTLNLNDDSNTLTTSSGIIMHWPRYVIHFTQSNSFAYSTTVIRSSNNIQENTMDGYNVGYRKVFEINTNKGYTEYNYNTYENYPDILFPDAHNIRKFLNERSPEDIFPIDLYTNFKNLYGTDQSSLRGKESLIKYYDNNGQALKETEFFYTDKLNFNNSSSIDNNNYLVVNHLTGYYVQGYKKYFNDTFLKKKIDREYLNGNTLTNTTEYIYDSPNHLNLTLERNFTSKTNESIEKRYYYAKDYSTDTMIQTMINNNIINTPIKSEAYKGGNFLSSQETNYIKDASTSNLILPKQIATLKGGQTSSENRVTYDNYDERGNIRQYTPEGGKPVTFIWGYNKTLPIAKIENATYADIQSQEANLQTLSNTGTESDLKTALDALRSLFPNAMITTYTHKPLIGISTITDPKGQITTYEYDLFNRLKLIKDHQGKIINEYRYNYRNQ